MADAKLIIKPPHMDVRMKRGFWPDFARMQETIKDAGYRPGDAGVSLRVTGKVVKLGDGLALDVDGMKTPVTLPLVASKEEPETVVHLGERHLGHTVEVEGVWQAPANSSGAGFLAVTAVPRASGGEPRK